jgi:hypothetical protein
LAELTFSKNAGKVIGDIYPSITGVKTIRPKSTKINLIPGEIANSTDVSYLKNSTVSK